MRSEKYVILRDKQSFTYKGDFFSRQPNIGMRAGARSLPEPQVAFETLYFRVTARS
jgi:hypothetical protein